MKYLLVFFALLSVNRLYGQSEELYHEIDKIIQYDTEIKYPFEKSFIVGIIYEDTSYIINFGPTHIDTFDLFEIGGLTKVFTSTLIHKLASQDLMDLQAPINSFLPLKYRNNSLQKYSLRDLMLHKIKFPKRPSDLSSKEYNISKPYAYYSKEDVLNYYARFEPAKMRSGFIKSVDYSHINYALLEIILEQKFKMPLEDLFQVHLFQDYGMLNTSLNFPGEVLSIGFDRSNMIPEPWEYSSFAGSEGLVSCMHDLIKFMRFSIESDKNYIQASHAIREDSKISKRLFHTSTWYMMKSKKAGKIYTHSGLTERHKAYMHFKKETKTGVVILCQSSIGTEDLGLLILRMLNDTWRK